MKKLNHNILLMLAIALLTNSAYATRSNSNVRTCIDIILEIAEENEEILELDLVDAEEVADDVIHHIDIDFENGRYYIQRPLGRGIEIPPVFYRGGASDLNLAYRRNTIESAVGNTSSNYTMARVQHGLNRQGNPQVVIEGDIVNIPMPEGYLPGGERSLRINVPNIVFHGDFHTRARVNNYLNDVLGHDFDLPAEGLQHLTRVENVLGHGGLRIVLSDPDNPRQVIKFYDPELIRSGNNLENLAQYQEMIGKNIQKEILLYDILVAIEENFVRAGRPAPFRVTRMLNRNSPNELAMGIFRYERIRGQIYRQINYFPGIERLVRAIDHEIFVLVARRYQMVATKGSYPDRSPRFVGYDLFSNIMLSSEYGNTPVVFDF